MNINKVMDIQMKLEQENLSPKEKQKLLAKLYTEEKKDDMGFILFLLGVMTVSPIILLYL